MPADLYASSGGGGGGGGGGSSSSPDVDTLPGQASAVSPGAETTVVSRVVPLGFSMKLHGVVASGNADAEWILYDDGVERFRWRSSLATHKPQTWGNGIPFASGHTVTLKVVHQTQDTIGGSTARNFYGSLIYRDA